MRWGWLVAVGPGACCLAGCTPAAARGLYVSPVSSRRPGRRSSAAAAGRSTMLARPLAPSLASAPDSAGVSSQRDKAVTPAAIGGRAERSSRDPRRCGDRGRRRRRRGWSSLVHGASYLWATSGSPAARRRQLPSPAAPGQPTQLHPSHRRPGRMSRWWPMVKRSMSSVPTRYGPPLPATRSRRWPDLTRRGRWRRRGRRSEAQRLIMGCTVGGSFGSGDEGRYFELTKLGDAYNNVDDPANAERSYREALAIQDAGADDPGLAHDHHEARGAGQPSRSTSTEADRPVDAGRTAASRSGWIARLFEQLDYYRAVTSAYEEKARRAEV